MNIVRHIKNLKSFSFLGNDEKGTTAITMALVAPIIFGGLAFGSEYGYFEHSKRRLQNAADTAAFAAGTQLRSGLDYNDQKAAAAKIAEESGFEPTVGTLTLYNPPPTGHTYAGDNSAVYVVLQQTVPRRFSKIYNKNSFTLTTDSTVLVNNGRPACILSLNPNMDDAIMVSGNTDVELMGCDLAANSISASAVSSGGNSAGAEANCVTTVGQVDDSHGAYTYTECADAIENAPVTRDPYENVPEPDSACLTWETNTNKFTKNNGNATSKPNVDNTDMNCYQGSGGNVNLSQDIELRTGEIYVLKDMKLKLTGGDSITGTNVVIFLTGNSSIDVSGWSTIDISAPDSGAYSGIALFGDRDNEIDMHLGGNTGVSIVGAIYSPYYNISTGAASDVTYIGNTASFTAGECTQVIAGGQVLFTGDSEFSVNCTNSGTTAIMAAQSVTVVE